jgi:hypothetical protein
MTWFTKVITDILGTYFVHPFWDSDVYLWDDPVVPWDANEKPAGWQAGDPVVMSANVKKDWQTENPAPFYQDK